MAPRQVQTNNYTHHAAEHSNAGRVPPRSPASSAASPPARRVMEWRNSGRTPPPQMDRRNSAGPTPPHYQRERDVEREYLLKTRILIEKHRNKCKHFPSKCIIKIAEGDILEAPEQYKVTSVAADLKCKRGVASQLARRIGPPSANKKPEVGDVLESASEDSTVLFLVTKNRTHDRAHRRFGQFIQNVQRAIERLARIIAKRGITEIAMPFICSGKYQLNWLYVRDLLRHNLRDIEVAVTVYYIPRERLSSPNQQITPRRNTQQRTPQRNTQQRTPRRNTQQRSPVAAQQVVQASIEREERIHVGPQSVSPVVSDLINRFESQCNQPEQWPLPSHPMSSRNGRRHQVPSHRNRVPQSENAPEPPPPGTTPTPSPQWPQRRDLTIHGPQLGHSTEIEVYNSDNSVTQMPSPPQNTNPNF